MSRTGFLRRRWVLAIVVGMLAAACSGDTASTTTTIGGGDATTTTVSPGTSAAPVDPGRTDVIIGVRTEPPTLDHTVNPAAAIFTIFLYNVTENLVQLAPDGRILPLLATDWSVSDDGLTYRFDLAQDRTWHTGEPFTADDVIWTFDYYMNHEGSPNAAEYARIDTVTKIDDHTVEIKLHNPSNAFLYSMAQRAGIMLHGDTFDTIAERLVGTGPYQMTEWRRGDSIVVERNPHWQGDLPAIERATFRFIPDANALVNAMLAGDIDAQIDLQGDRAPDIENNPNLVLVEVPTTLKEPLGLNLRNPILQDIRVRQAIHHAVNRNDIIEATAGGYGRYIGVWATQLDPWYMEYDPYPYNPDRARELLAEAGYEPGEITLNLRVARDITATPNAEIVAAHLAEVGINVEVMVDDFPVWQEEAYFCCRHEFDMLTVGLSRGRELTRFVQPLTTGNPPGDWFNGYVREDFRELVQAADRATSEDEMIRLAQEALKMLADDAVNVMLINRLNLGAHHVDLEGWQAFRADNSVRLMDLRWNE
jgi:peptide/nickel transport system substrate-binding protein